MTEMQEDKIQSQVDLIREVFLYANRFKGKRFVIQIHSGIVEDHRFPTLVRDLAILHKSGIQIILVPGAGKRIDEVLGRYDLESRKVKGIRVSATDAMPLIKMAAFDVANMVMTQLSTQQVDAVIGNWVKARSYGVRDGVDYQNAGTVARINAPLLNRILADGFVPILPCIGWSASGVPYNISSLELASVLAEQLGAEKLFFLTDGLALSQENHACPKDGIVVRSGMITRLSAAAAEEFVQLNKVDFEENPETWNGDYQILDLLRLAAHATRSQVERVHILDGRLEGVILKEIFSTLGQGTMIHGDPFDSIRNMQASDIAEVLGIMEPNIQKGILIRRDETDMLNLYKDFVVYETDGTIHGCGALHDYGDLSAEIAGLAVDSNFAHLGMGQKILLFLIERARDLGLKKVFLLTTQTGDFFESMGFVRGGLSDLPQEKQKHYNPARNSRIYFKDLDNEKTLSIN